MTLNTSKLSNTIASIEKNIQKYGMERFDPTDIRKIPIICKPYKWSKLLRKMVLAADNLSPILVRKALGITPTKLHVTAFTTLANAYLKMEASGIYKSAVYDSRYFVDLYVNDYVKGTDPNKWWQHKGLGINFFNINVGNKLATMHMHGLARANITLIDVGNFYMDKRYLDIATFSAFSVLDSHQVIDYKDGTKSVSYYYNSYDCTLNVNSEYAQGLSMLPQNCHNVKSLSVLNGILRLLLKEQNDDGSWYYFSRWHMETYRLTPSCDCHHSATVLYNMINITKCSYIEHNIKKAFVVSIEKGMEFFINAFYNLSTGKGIEVLGLSRPACSVQYAETIFALCEYLSCPDFYSSNTYLKAKNLLPLLVDRMIELVNLEDGSAPSEKIIRWSNINSIRWGNGPILQAIATYSLIYDSVYKQK